MRGAGIAFALISSAGLLACAKTTHQSAAWAQFSEYRTELLERSETVAHERYLAPNLLALADNAASPRERAEIFHQLTTPAWFADIDGYAEGREGERHCLTVNGVSTDGERMSTAYEYVYVSGSPKIAAVEVLLLDSSQTYPKGYWCPQRLDF